MLQHKWDENITEQHITHFLGTWQSQKYVNSVILPTSHKTDLARLKICRMNWQVRSWDKVSASKFNYILILWKLQKCWPLGEFNGLQSYSIEYVLLLYTALRLVVGGLNRKTMSKRISVCSSYFCFRCLWLMCPILEESIFLTKEEPAFPGDIVYSCIRFIFCCHGLPGFTLHLLQGGNENWIHMVKPHMLCVTWVQCEGLLPPLGWIHSSQAAKKPWKFRRK